MKINKYIQISLLILALLFINCTNEEKKSNLNEEIVIKTIKTSSKKTVKELINFDEINNYSDLKSACSSIHIDSVKFNTELNYSNLTSIERIAYVLIFENQNNINNIPDSLIPLFIYTKQHLTLNYLMYHNNNHKELNELFTSEYINENKKEYSWYEPAGGHMFKIFQSILNLESKGMNKENVCNLLVRYYKWNALEGNNWHEIDKIIQYVKGASAENKIINEIAKHYLYKINCKQTINEHTDGPCGPWPEYQQKLDEILNSYTIEKLPSFDTVRCECWGC